VWHDVAGAAERAERLRGGGGGGEAGAAEAGCREQSSGDPADALFLDDWRQLREGGGCSSSSSSEGSCSDEFEEWSNV
jgi:hypothetical protein